MIEAPNSQVRKLDLVPRAVETHYLPALPQPVSTMAKTNSSISRQELPRASTELEDLPRKFVTIPPTLGGHRSSFSKNLHYSIAALMPK